MFSKVYDGTKRWRSSRDIYIHTSHPYTLDLTRLGMLHGKIFLQLSLKQRVDHAWSEFRHGVPTIANHRVLLFELPSVDKLNHQRPRARVRNSDYIAREAEDCGNFRRRSALCALLTWTTVAIETRTEDSRNRRLWLKTDSVTKKKATLRRNPEEFGERSKRGKKKRGRKEESERGNQLCGHYWVFPRWPSHWLRQLALALATTAKGTTQGERRGFTASKRTVEAARSWMEATVPGNQRCTRLRGIYSSTLDELA